MNNTKITSKEYWNILKIELSKNKRAVFLLFLFIVIFASFILWNAPASSSITERLMVATAVVVPFIVLILLVIPIATIYGKRYANAIVGKNPWEIAEINFRRYAIGLFILFVMIVIPNVSFFPSVFVSAVAPILFIVIASLLKRKSPKATTVGYTCLRLLLIIVVCLLFYSIFNRHHEPFWIFFLTFLLLGLGDIYKASKYTADIKRDSEFQKEIIKIKNEEK